MRLDSLHPGATVEARARVDRLGVAIARRPGRDAGPTADELRLIREELDPDGVYTK